MRRADAERGRLQGLSLVTAPDPYPVLRILLRADEDRDPGR
jgi:hypothetical protein